MITGETLIIKTSADNVKSVTVDIYTKNNNNFEKMEDINIIGKLVNNEYIITIPASLTIKFTPITVVILNLTMEDGSIVKKDLWYDVKQF
jgi:hypothetical protein